MAQNGTVTPTGDHGNSGAEHGIPDIGDILSGSAIMQRLRGESLPEDDDVPAPDDSLDDDDVPNPDDGDGNAEDNDGDDSDTEGNDEADSKDTQGGDLPTEDDIDWEYKVPVKIDGKEEYFTLEELRKGYATQQHLSAKGRELGELRKQLETEKDEKLQEVVALSTSLHAQIEAEEKDYASQYHTIKEKMDKAVEDGDGYEAKELKAQLTEVQKKYWAARERKEELGANVSKHLEQAQQAQHEQLMEYFTTNIGKVMPEFTPEIGQQVREFALSEGIPEGLLNGIYEPTVIKLLNDYRVLKQKTAKGAEKRKEAPVSKHIPTRKGTPQKVRDERARQVVRERVFTDGGSKDDQLDFLKGISKIGSKLK